MNEQNQCLCKRRRFSICKSHNNQKLKKSGNPAGCTFRSRDPAGSAIGGRITGFIRRGRISGRTLVFSCSRRCLPNLFIINLSYSGGSAPCTVLSILLDGSHEPPVVMTKQKFRESHRVASLMPKGSEDTQRSSTMVINFLPGYAHCAQQHATLSFTRVTQTLGLHFMFKLFFFSP